MNEHDKPPMHKGQDKDNDLSWLDNAFEYEKFTPERMLAEAEKCIQQGNETKEKIWLFTMKTANDWIEQAKTRPIPEMLFDKFWYEGELCILFSDTNLGKSVLAVQIANSISKGDQIMGFRLGAIRQPILYFDFELSDKQFEARYSMNFEQDYVFDDNFLRVEINPDAGYTENPEEFLNQSFENAIISCNAKGIIIDNLTYLRDETEKAKYALPLMKYLRELKKKYGLSILALAHTPKRDLSKPITRNDLGGSKMLINFTDSAFAIGESTADKSLRYLKQIKARNTEVVYDTENVCICQITKPSNFLQFEFLSYGTEREHLRQQSEGEKMELEANVKSLLESVPEITAYEIAKRLCPDDNKFGSFKVKIYRMVSSINSNISNNGNTCY